MFIFNPKMAEKANIKFTLYELNIKFENYCYSTLIFIRLLLKAFQGVLHFSSLVLLSPAQTFLLARDRVEHFQPLSQSKFIPL